MVTIPGNSSFLTCKICAKKKVSLELILEYAKVENLPVWSTHRKWRKVSACSSDDFARCVACRADDGVFRTLAFEVETRHGGMKFGMKFESRGRWRVRGLEGPLIYLFSEAPQSQKLLPHQSDTARFLSSSKSFFVKDESDELVPT